MYKRLRERVTVTFKAWPDREFNSLDLAALAKSSQEFELELLNSDSYDAVAQVCCTCTTPVLTVPSDHTLLKSLPLRLPFSLSLWRLRSPQNFLLERPVPPGVQRVASHVGEEHVANLTFHTPTVGHGEAIGGH
eukprot:SAG11_NODE_8087_length_1061_cov_1.646570_1_plen_134_part_00